MKVLVYHIGQLGDTIVSIPALRAVRRYFGHATRISMLHDATHRLVTAEMVLDGSALVDDFIPYSPAKGVGTQLPTVAKLWRRLRRERFDAVVSLLPSDRAARALVRDRWFFRACGIPRLIGFRPYTESEIRPRCISGRPARTPNEASLRLRRLFAEGVMGSDNYFAPPLLSVSREREAAIDRWLRHRRKHPHRPLIALCPGCKKRANSWPANSFLEIARRLIELDRFEIAILGGPVERDLAHMMVDALDGRAINAAGCFSVMESAALLARCSLLVGLDTGSTHLAAAVGVPCVVIQSANSFPGQWDPLGDGHVVIRAEGTCAGCQLQTCPVAGHPCMREITVDRVWSAMETPLSEAEYERYASHSHA